MKITVPEDFFEQIARRVKDAAQEIVRKATGEEQENELFHKLRLSGSPEKDQVIEYLKRTNRTLGYHPRIDLIKVPTNYVATGLGIYPHKMKAIREALVAEGIVKAPAVTRGPIMIVYRRPKSTT